MPGRRAGELLRGSDCGEFDFPVPKSSCGLQKLRRHVLLLFGEPRFRHAQCAAIFTEMASVSVRFGPADVFWTSYAVGKDIDEVWWPADLVNRD